MARVGKSKFGGNFSFIHNALSEAVFNESEFVSVDVILVRNTCVSLEKSSEIFFCQMKVRRNFRYS